MSSALYYRGPSEPGGDDDIIAEVVDGKLRRGIEISSDGVARCIGFDDYPLAVDMTDVADYVWRISEQEFNEEWGRHCS